MGLVDDKAVRFSGAQAEGCSPIAQAYREGRDFVVPGEAQYCGLSRLRSAIRPMGSMP